MSAVISGGVVTLNKTTCLHRWHHLIVTYLVRCLPYSPLVRKHHATPLDVLDQPPSCQASGMGPVCLDLMLIMNLMKIRQRRTLLLIFPHRGEETCCLSAFFAPIIFMGYLGRWHQQLNVNFMFYFLVSEERALCELHINNIINKLIKCDIYIFIYFIK